MFHVDKLSRSQQWHSGIFIYIRRRVQRTGSVFPFISHDDVIKWKHFPRHWHFVRGIHRSPVNSPKKGQWRGALIFFFGLRLNKRLSKQQWGWWFETPSRSLWRLVMYGSTLIPARITSCTDYEVWWNYLSISKLQRRSMWLLMLSQWYNQSNKAVCIFYGTYCI